MGKFALIWIANGFDPADPDSLDCFSRDTLHRLLEMYTQYRSQGQGVKILIPNYRVRSRSGRVLVDVMRDAIIPLVLWGDVQISQEGSINLLNNCDIVAAYEKANQGTQIFVFLGHPVLRNYFESSYRAMCKILRVDATAEALTFATENISWRTRGLYTALGAWTQLLACSLSLFRGWFAFRKLHDNRRTHNFVRTVK